MGKKKTTDPKTSSDELATVSAPPSVFQALFGNAGGESAAVSIFSSGNPFRRKDSDSVPAVAAAATENYPNGGSDDVKSRKKGKEKKVETDLEVVKSSSEIKKSKRKEKSRDRELDDGESGLESQGVLKKKSEKKGAVSGSENLKVGSEFGGGLKMDEQRTDSKLSEDVELMKEKKKKRKRDELEREYEAKKYGASQVAEDGEEASGGNVVGKKRKALDDPSQMLVTKEGFDDESKLLRTVFVGNLPLKVKKKSLGKEFSQFGEIESVRIRSVPLGTSKKPRKGAILAKKVNESADSSHAYVVFKTEESAQASLSHNMAVIAGNHIRVDRACPPRKKLKVGTAPIYDPKRTIFVGNLPFDVKDEELYQLFCGIENLGSSVEAVRVIRDPNMNIGKGFAYVFFKTREAANSVVNKQNLELRGRTLRLFHAKPNLTSTPLNKRNKPSTEAGHSPAKKRAVDSGFRTPDSCKRVMPKTTVASYQGLRASKTGSQKKILTKGSSMKRPKSYSNSKEKPVDLKRKRPEKTSDRKNGKRPSVAKRKAVANSSKNGVAAPKQAGVKRKSNSSRTPESSHRNKRVKMFR